MAGKVWLTGAGPGDVELLTLKAKKVIEQADVVVYDSLVGKALLALLPDSAEAVNVGKRAGCHTMPQDKINQLLVKKAMEGKKVVRLKGGDPFLFGRGGEEALCLAEKGIPFEIVPGITSAIAVPAYGGIPVTHRDMASMVHIITGHKKRSEPLDIDFFSLARAGGSFVFLMGISALKEICQGLLDAGMEKDTPAAVISLGTTARQQRIMGNIFNLPQKVSDEKVKTPAVIIVGMVCTLGETLDWQRQLPLCGMRFVVTRPRNRAYALSEKLRELGGEVIEIPAIVTVPYKENEALKEAVEKIEAYQILAFTSPAGVEFFFHLMQKWEKDIRCLFPVKLAAIGSGTKKALEEKGLIVDFVPKQYESRAFGKMLCDTAPPNANILLPRARDGSRELLEELSKRKDITVTEIPIYDTLAKTYSVISLGEEIEKGEITEAVFTSASTVRGFLEMAEGADVSDVTAYCIGEKTAQEAKKAGMKCVVAKEASVDALVEVIVKHQKSGKKQEVGQWN